MSKTGIVGLMAALVVLPGIAAADFSAEAIGQTPTVSSMLLQPPVAYQSREAAPLMFQGPFDASRLGLAMSYSDPQSRSLNQAPGWGSEPVTQERRFSATAYGEYSFSERVGVFGRFGIRQLSSDEQAATPLLDTIGHASHLDRRYSLGLKVNASEVLSLHFEWERYAQGNESGAAATPSNGGWDPWQQRNVFGAGVRLGF